MVNMPGIEKKASFFGPFVASVPAFMTQLLAGVLEGHAAVLVPQLNDPASPVLVSKDDTPWTVSLGFVLTPFFAVIGKPLMDVFGRKCVLYLFFILSTFGFLSVAVAYTPAHIYLGRVLSSAAYGLSPCSLSYVAEICSDDQRPNFLFALSLMRPLGLVVAYSLGTLPLNICGMVFVVTSHLGLLYVFHVPQSPVWLVNQSRLAEAATSLKWLRSDHDVIDKEIAAMKTSTEEEFQQRSGLAAFFDPKIFKPFATLVAYTFLQHATGILVVLCYAQEFFDSLNSTFNSSSVIILVAIFRAFITGFWVFASGKFNKASLTSGAAFGASFMLLVVCALLIAYPDAVGRNEELEIMLVSLCTGYVLIGSGIDVQNLPVDLRTVFPPNVQGAARAGIKFFSHSHLFFFLILYPFLSSALGLTWILFFFGVSAFALGLLVKCVLPKFADKICVDDTAGAHSTNLQLTTYL